MLDHAQVRWWHSIDLGGGIVTRGAKSQELLETEFAALRLDDLQGKRVLDVGCNDGFMSLRCERLGADVVGIDGVFRDGLRVVRDRLKPKFEFYCLDVLSPSFLELGHFDVILYLGVLYHTMYPFEQLTRLAAACKPGGVLIVESEFRNIPGSETVPTIIYNFDGHIVADLTSPTFPSIPWIEQVLRFLGFGQIETTRKIGDHHRGRITLKATHTSPTKPFLFAQESSGW